MARGFHRIRPGLQHCAVAAGAVLLAAACSRAPAGPGPAPQLPATKERARRAPSPADWFWEPVETDVRSTSRGTVELPLTDDAIVRTEGAVQLWNALAPEARERLRRDGVLVLGADGTAATAKRDRSMGAFYTDLRTQRIPHLLTLDALFSLVHGGVVRALAQVEEFELAPTLQLFLARLDARLAAEAAGAATELIDPYRLARGVVAVALSLSSPSYAPPGDLARTVADERANIERHAGTAKSPLLGISVDYAQFVVPSSAARPDAYRALAWLGAAPLTLVARSEVPGAPIGVGQARTNTRTAMLLARLCDRDIDAATHAAYTRVARLLSFIWGAPDDLGLGELDDVADGAGIDLTKPENVSNVTRVDKVRARALAGRTPLTYDGAGVTGRAGLNVRMFGGHASPDAIALQSLVGPPVGLAQEPAAKADIDRLRKGQRVLPSTLDVAAWFGAPEARELLRDSAADAFDGYGAALTKAQEARATLDQSGRLHASVHGSLLDALIAWANAAPSAGVARSPAANRMRVESLLAAWTLTRHTGQAMARARPPAAAPAGELHISGAALPVFVEPMPEVVARLVALVRQLRRGLEAVGRLAPSAPATAALVEIEDILRIAEKGAERHASDEPPTPEEASALAALPARIARLEDAASEEVGPVIAAVHSDPPSRRVLATATGWIEPALMLARDPVREELILVVGAHLAHYELVETGTATLTDAAWRARLSATGTDVAHVPKPPRPSWVESFHWTR